MKQEIRVPQLPESVSDATILDWHKQPGDSIQRDENLVDLETDKVVLEVPAPANGVLSDINYKTGEIVTADQVLALVDVSAVAGTDAPQKEKPEISQVDDEVSEEIETSHEIALSPSVRRIVKEHDIDISKITGTGKNGRILKSDVINYLSAVEDDNSDTEDEIAALKTTRDKQQLQNQRAQERVPMTRLRARIAERLVQSQQTAAILTTFNEVDLHNISGLRKKYRDHFEQEHAVRLGYMSFFVKACVEALKKFPVVNASVDSNEIVYHGYYDIGIAVGSPRGLVVPVLRDVDQMSFAEVEQGIKDYGKKAQEGTLSYDELNGGTFTISNGGVYGSMLSTPILNPPQSGILGMHNIQQRPVVIDGEIKIRPMMYLALSYDHRIIDGREAVQFLLAIKNNLEDPSRILLQL